VASIKVRATLKDKTSPSRDTPTQLLADHTANVRVEVRPVIGQRDSVKHPMHREKAKAFLADPQSFSNLKIPQD